ncbi:glycerophosphodiester phosphodiesterase family protein [Pseudooceanicola sp. HF7]|uniref:glycerophosphodiester phosphodiesterase family protein n=1 Tax=Pseudooceanicola sp. HF7 TaxID=2721560 RepID=UPI0014309B45|nr:glycerophosphodiester phosphodiesterase family protein [Pseudooceanicola sp. HF7]NIZ11163.1 phosphodiesterase [Pseudooceanicola sp. HF7]
MPSTPALPGAFLRAPVAHRAYHDRDAGRPENSIEAVQAAIDAGYGIEIDLQLSADGVAMVFHDATLDRVTGESGPINGKTARQLGEIPLTGGKAGIPTFAEVLELVAGRVPLLVEIKDQHGAMGPVPGALEEAAAQDAMGYEGPLAFMSFNPHSMVQIARQAPQFPRGLTTAAYDPEHWSHLSDDRRAELAAISALEDVGASFISHQANDLTRERITGLRDSGFPVLCWTIRSAEEEALARAHADNVTFEHYPAPIPA